MQYLDRVLKYVRLDTAYVHFASLVMALGLVSLGTGTPGLDLLTAAADWLGLPGSWGAALQLWVTPDRASFLVVVAAVLLATGLGGLALLRQGLVLSRSNATSSTLLGAGTLLCLGVSWTWPAAGLALAMAVRLCRNKDPQGRFLALMLPGTIVFLTFLNALFMPIRALSVGFTRRDGYQTP